MPINMKRSKSVQFTKASECSERKNVNIEANVRCAKPKVSFAHSCMVMQTHAWWTDADWRQGVAQRHARCGPKQFFFYSGTHREGMDPLSN